MGETLKRVIEEILASIGEILYPYDEECVICGEKYIEGLCTSCKNGIVKCDDEESYGYYMGVMKELISKFKFHDDFQCGEILANMISKDYKFEGLDEFIVTSIPLTKKVYKKRGFNQSEYIAKIFSKNKNLKYKNILVKIKDTTPQKELDRFNRERNVIGVFTADESVVKDKKILIIDDVKTTGSTLKEAKKTLLLLGAKEVRVLTVSKSNI